VHVGINAATLERVIFDQILCRHIYHHTPADAPHIVRAHGFDASVLKNLHEQLVQHHMEKRYTALVKGTWSKKCHSIDAPL
jgi:hypothetical protein